MKKEYAKLENHIISLFKKETSFTFFGKEYETLVVGKPRPASKNGECKTDVYVKGKHNDEIIELKLSVKLKNKHEWQESKVSSERAEAIFGENWSNIIQSSSEKIKHKFEALPLLYCDKKGTTKENSATMGWRLEITNKERNLSVPINLRDKEIKESIYKGENLPEAKKDSLVNGSVVKNSGVANYIIYTTIDELHSTADVVKAMENIDDMIVPTTYLTFIANNYRVKEKKIDGSRPLAVHVKWSIINEKLTPEIVFDSPLFVKGRSLVTPFLNELSKLEKNYPSELDSIKDVSKIHLLHRQKNSA